MPSTSPADDERGAAARARRGSARGRGPAPGRASAKPSTAGARRASPPPRRATRAQLVAVAHFVALDGPPQNRAPSADDRACSDEVRLAGPLGAAVRQAGLTRCSVFSRRRLTAPGRAVMSRMKAGDDHTGSHRPRFAVAQAFDDELAAGGGSKQGHAAR